MSARVVSMSGSPAVMNGMKPRRPARRRLMKASLMRLTRFLFGLSRLLSGSRRLLRASSRLLAESLRDGLHVFVAAPGEVDDDCLLARHLARHFDCVRDCVSGFERGDDAFELRD